MNILIGTAGLILAAALSPGPNNILVLERGRERGLRSALEPMAGIIMGGMAMITLARAGFGALAVQSVWIRTAILAGGATYLAGLGLLVILRPTNGDSASASHTRIAPSGALGTFAFQFINPKTWLLALTVSSASGCLSSCDRQPAVTTVLLTFAVISFVSLLGWAALGRLAERFMQRRALRARFERAMGILLVASAASLLLA